MSVPLAISRSTFRCLWCIVVAYTTANAIFLLSLAWCYYDFLNPSSTLKQIAHSFFFSRPWAFLVKNHTIIASGYLLLALPNLYGIYRMLRYTLHHKHLAFGPVPRGNSTRLTILYFEKYLASVSVIKQCLKLSNACGINGAWFVQSSLVVKTGEVVLQIAQAYRSSQYISNRLVNQLYGVMIFVNCWSMPVILFLWDRHKKMQSRLLCVVANVVLGFTWGTVIQGCIFARYYKMNADGHWPSAVPETYERELGRMLIISFPNFLLSTFSFMTSGWGVLNIAEVLAQQQFTTVATGNQVAVLRFASQFTGEGPIADPTTETDPIPSARVVATVGALTDQWRIRENGKPSKLVATLTKCHVVTMMVLGTVILILSVGSFGLLWPLEGSTVKCLDQLYPWFTNKVSCVGRQISCAQFGISGAADEINTALEPISSYMLANLGISDCSALEMTPRILDFQQLQTLTLLNVTVVKWDTDAAIAAPLFPQLQTLAMQSVHFNCTPRGIITKPFPSSFEWMYAQHMNADTFIDAVGGNWNMMVYFYCRNCNLSAMPQAVHFMSDLQTETQMTSVNAPPKAVRACIYSIELAYPLPQLDLSRNCFRACFGERKNERFLEIMRRHYGRIRSNFRIGFIVFWISVFVPANAGRGLAVISTLLATPVVFCSSMMACTAMLKILLSEQEFEYFTLINMCFYVGFAVIFSDVRSIQPVFGVCTAELVIMSDSLFRTAKSTIKSTVVALPVVLSIGVVVYLRQVYVSPAQFVHLAIGHVTIEASDLILNAALTLTLLYLRIIYRRRNLVSSFQEGAIPCVIHRARLKLTPKTATKTAPPSTTANADSSTPHLQVLRLLPLTLTEVDARRTVWSQTWSQEHRYASIWRGIHYVLGLTGVTLAVLTTFLPSMSILEDRGAGIDSKVALIPPVAFVCSVMYVAPFVLIYQVEILHALMRKFDVLFVAWQFGAAAVSLGDMLLYDYRAWVVCAWCVWYVWILLLDAITPLAAKRLGLRRWHAAVVVIANLFCIGCVLYVFAYGDSTTLVDKQVFTINLSAEASIKMHTGSFFVNRVIPIIIWSIRLLQAPMEEFPPEIRPVRVAISNEPVAGVATTAGDTDQK
ncbi:TPA: hypothetical protein N0F65_004954 [Lagenidium giganteum]|uniref:Uncharacterized protein n=1 Tax=Lagenidium giganteum TaxID=4803 RepID=A0AAV2YZE8_9STRA|nr:TPA: hypothetical protein N0F65_004954 [Lagenidium giganteum]